MPGAEDDRSGVYLLASPICFSEKVEDPPCRGEVCADDWVIHTLRSLWHDRATDEVAVANDAISVWAVRAVDFPVCTAGGFGLLPSSKTGWRPA